MKLEHHGSEVISNSTHKVHKFGVNDGALMFRVLSSTLYPDKIKAVIRELACMMASRKLSIVSCDTFTAVSAL